MRRRLSCTFFSTTPDVIHIWYTLMDSSFESIMETWKTVLNQERNRLPGVKPGRGSFECPCDDFSAWLAMWLAEAEDLDKHSECDLHIGPSLTA